MNCIAPGCSRPRTLGALFCDLCIQAPAGKRGGWISAEQRRRKLAASKDATLDISNVAKRLWVGGKPPFDRDLPEFDVLVLCAEELQPPRVAFGRRVVRCPLPDAELSMIHQKRALLGAQSIAKELLDRNRVLVASSSGLNRAPLVAGLALGLVTRATSDQIIDLLRARRNPKALGNEAFQGYLRRYVVTARRS